MMSVINLIVIGMIRKGILQVRKLMNTVHIIIMQSTKTLKMSYYRGSGHQFGIVD